jgi:translation initiation factor IF-3
VPVPRRFDRRPPERDTTRINERIRVPEVRLINEKGEQVGVLSRDDALEYARERDLDLVEVAPEASPPVCRILDYSKYKYEQEQKSKAARKHQQQITVREIKFRPKIAVHDYETKKGHVMRFLNHRDKVKVTIMFRGREMAHPERGQMLLERLAEDLGELAIIEQRPLQDGRNMTMMLGPGKLAGAEKAAADAAAAAEAGESMPDGDAAAPAAPEPAVAAAPEPAQANGGADGQPDAAPEAEGGTEGEPEAAPEPAAAAEPEAEVAPEPEAEPEAEPEVATEPEAAAEPEPKPKAKPKARAKAKAKAKPAADAEPDAQPEPEAPEAAA